ncbi:MAG: hypothetical protein M3309_09365, partial [Actinomycetota bacterium]|nr:hypothetical protein [Actinomycetota bacterium]
MASLMNSGSTKLSKTIPASSNTAEFQVPVVTRDTPHIGELSFAGRPSAGDARDLIPVLLYKDFLPLARAGPTYNLATTVILFARGPYVQYGFVDLA